MTPTKTEILADIRDTEAEIHQYESKKKLFPQLIPGYDLHIAEKVKFIEKLKKLLVS